MTDLSVLAQQAALMDMVLRMVQLLLALAIIIAVLGIVNTLALSVLERTREIGMLRAVGLTRSAITRMVTVESVVISVFGALLGIVVGSALGAAVVNALAEEGVEQLALPWASFGIYLALSAAVGVVAAVLPAIRAARTTVLAAIAHACALRRGMVGVPRRGPRHPHRRLRTDRHISASDHAPPGGGR